MKNKDPFTPKKTIPSSAKEKSGFMANSQIMKFLDDVKDGDLEKFDVTTTKGFWKELLVRIKIVDITGLGSQLAFFFLLSLFPLLIFLITLLPFLNIDESQVFLFIRDYAPESVYALIHTTLQEILQNRNGGLLSIGVLATIWSASKGMNALTKALNRSYHVEESRSFIVARAMSVVFTIALIVVLVIALAVTSIRSTDWNAGILLFWNGRRIREIMGEFAMGHPASTDFPCVYRNLLGGAEFEAPIEKCDARRIVRDGGLDIDFTRIFLLCRQFCQLLKDVRQHRGNYRPHDVALFFSDHPNAWRSIERSHDGTETGSVGKRKEQCSRMMILN